MHGNAGEAARAFALVRRGYWFAFRGLLQTNALRINVTRTKVMKFLDPYLPRSRNLLESYHVRLGGRHA